MDDESFESFMAAALPGLLRCGHLLTGDPHRAEELVQVALVRTYLRWKTVDRTTPQAYVRAAMVNTHTSWWRRGRREGRCPPATTRLSQWARCRSTTTATSPCGPC